MGGPLRGHGGVSKGWGDHGGVSHEGVGCVKFYKSDLRPAPVAFLPLSRFQSPI